MLDTTRLVLFLFTAFVILITPGPAVLYIIARSVDQGRMAGIVSTLGVGLGTMFHVAAAAFGVSALLATSATATSARWSRSCLPSPDRAGRQSSSTAIPGT